MSKYLKNITYKNIWLAESENQVKLQTKYLEIKKDKLLSYLEIKSKRRLPKVDKNPANASTRMIEKKGFWINEEKKEDKAIMRNHIKN